MSNGLLESKIGDLRRRIRIAAICSVIAQGSLQRTHAKQHVLYSVVPIEPKTEGI